MSLSSICLNKTNYLNGINFRFAAPTASEQTFNPRLEASEGTLDCLSRIWKVFVDRIKSCFSCFGFFSNSTPSISEREFHLIQDESQIGDRLTKQMRLARDQMQAEPRKSFHCQNAPASWDMHEERVGGYQVGISHTQGRRPTMEDEHLATSFNLTIAGRNYPVQLFGIFDGHGGREASRYVRDHLKVKLQEALLEFNATGLSDAGIWKVLKMATVRLNRDFKNAFGDMTKNQGTTATVAMVLNQKLWTANVGDARTVLDNAGNAIQLTEDAKPSMTRYRRGIEKRGGFVLGNRVNGDLAVARAIGDHRLNGAVSARPKITAIPLNEIRPHSHLVLCCDGIFDVARSQDVVGAVHANQALSAGMLARNIVYSAYQSGSTDNLSSMVIKIA